MVARQEAYRPLVKAAEGVTGPGQRISRRAPHGGSRASPESGAQRAIGGMFISIFQLVWRNSPHCGTHAWPRVGCSTTRRTLPPPLAMASTSAFPPPQFNAEDLPPLGVLDEDDEFEEFDAQDWHDTDTALAHLSDKNVYISNGAAAAPSAPGSAVGLSMVGGASGRTGEDHLWADNWDDDDVEDDFSKALRYASHHLCCECRTLAICCTDPRPHRPCRAELEKTSK